MKAAQTALEAAKTARDAAQAEYDKIAAEVPNIEEQKMYGSVGFFESVGAGYALSAFEEAINTKLYECTILGDPNDTTYLENMKETFAHLRRCNELRASENLDPLMVTDSLMAISQLQTNWSSENILQHSDVFNVSENLAWGYRDDPYSGWYFAEKEIFDKNPNADFIEVGHYLNIVDPTHKYTGFAVAKNRNEYKITHGQVFDTEPNPGEPVYTVDEYEARFMEYYNKLMNGEVGQPTPEQQEALEAAQKKLDAAQKNVTAAENTLATKVTADNAALADYNNKAKAHEAAVKQYFDANKQLEEAKKNLPEKEADKNNAKNALDDAVKAYAIAKSEAEKATADYAPLKDKVDEAEKALAEAAKACDSKKAAYEKLQSEYKTLTGKEFTGTSEDAAKNLDAANKLLAEKKKAKEALDQKFVATQTKEAEAQAKYNASENAVKEKKTALDKANEKVAELESAMQSNLAEKRKAVEEKTKALEDAKALADAKTKEANDLSDKLGKLKADLADAKAKLPEAEKAQADTQKVAKDAETVYQDAKKAYDEAVKGSEDVKAAQEEYDKALAAEKNLKTEYDNAKNKTADTEKTYADVLDMLNKAQDKLKRAQGLSFEAAKENEITDPDFAYLNDYVARAKAAEKKAEDANAAVSALAEALEKAKAEYEKAKKARELAELNLMLAQAEYDMFAPQEKPEEPKPEGQTPAGKPEQKPEKPSGQEDSKDKASATGDVNDMTQAAVAGAGAVGILALLKSRFRKRED